MHQQQDQQHEHEEHDGGWDEMVVDLRAQARQALAAAAASGPDARAVARATVLARYRAWCARRRAAGLVAR